MKLREVQKDDLDSILNLIAQNSDVLAPNNRMIYYLCCTVFKDLSFVAVEKDEIIGFVCVFTDHNKRYAWIHQLAVSPKARRRGIATSLLEKMEDRIINTFKTINAIKLAVKRDNHSAKTLYEKSNYSLKELDFTIDMEILQKDLKRIP